MFPHIESVAGLVEPAAARAFDPAITLLPAADTASSQPSTRALRKSRPFLFAARLRSIAKLNRCARRNNANKSHDAPAKTAKRAPQLYPVKRKKLVAKRPKTKIIVAKPKRPSAIIIRLPLRTPKAANARQTRAA